MRHLALVGTQHLCGPTSVRELGPFLVPCIEDVELEYTSAKEVASIPSREGSVHTLARPAPARLRCYSRPATTAAKIPLITVRPLDDKLRNSIAYSSRCLDVYQSEVTSLSLLEAFAVDIINDTKFYPRTEVLARIHWTESRSCLWTGAASARPLAHRLFVAVNETFPLAAVATTPADLPSVPSWNRPPVHHVPESTPIFIGFTRNWFLLQQTVVSLITAGWPPEDIYVVENTGVMDANQKGKLTTQNPFFLDHHRLIYILGVNVLVTPSLQTFAQLQNFYLYESLNRGWPHYFWAHMDIVVQSGEDQEPYQSFYQRCVEALQKTSDDPRWGLRFFAYDWLTLMNVEALVELGGWDTMISYYTADCDLYERMHMAKMSTKTAAAGPIYDSGESFPDLAVLYRRKSVDDISGSQMRIEDSRGSELWAATQKHLEHMTHVKNSGVRNRWQWQQMGGRGEPYYRDMDGFTEALEYMVQAGVKTWEAKWGITGCSLGARGLRLGDEWMVDHVEEGHST